MASRPRRISSTTTRRSRRLLSATCQATERRRNRQRLRMPRLLYGQLGEVRSFVEIEGQLQRFRPACLSKRSIVSHKIKRNQIQKLRKWLILITKDSCKLPQSAFQKWTKKQCSPDICFSFVCFRFGPFGFCTSCACFVWTRWHGSSGCGGWLQSDLLCRGFCVRKINPP